MKTNIYSRDGGLTEIYFEAENTLENVELLKLIKRTKKPNRMNGSYRENGILFAWLTLPSKRTSDSDILRVSSE